MSIAEGTSVARGAPATTAAAQPDVAQPFSLVVPLYNEERRFRSASKAFEELMARQPEGSELIFVDDGSADGTAAAVEGFAAARPGLSIRLLREPHRGKGAAVQAGLDAAVAPYAAFCDVDLA